jgi:hypothetical protein
MKAEEIARKLEGQLDALEKAYMDVKKGSEEWLKIEKAVDEVLDRIASRDDYRKVAKTLSQEKRHVLRGYAWGLAERAVAEGNIRHLIRGLIALSLCGLDEGDVEKMLSLLGERAWKLREVYWGHGVGGNASYLPLFGRSARLCRRRREEVFAAAADIVGESEAKALIRYAREGPREDARLIRRLGYVELKSQNSFQYGVDLAKTGWF